MDDSGDAAGRARGARRRPANVAPGPIERHLTILEIVAASQRGLTLTEVANAAGLPKASAYRLTHALVAAGALELDGGGAKLFRVGERLWRMLYLGQSGKVVVSYAQIVVDELATSLGETSYAVRLTQTDVRSIASCILSQGYSLHVVPGLTMPFHAAASAKAILAFQGEDTVARSLAGPLDRFAARTMTDADAVRRQLAAVRAEGFAVCDREMDDNVIAYAAPVHLEGAGVIYAVGVAGPASRMSRLPPAHFAAALVRSADRLASMLTSAGRPPSDA